MAIHGGGEVEEADARARTVAGVEAARERGRRARNWRGCVRGKEGKTTEKYERAG